MLNSLQVRIGLITALLIFVFTGGGLMAQPIGSNSGPRSNQENSPYSRYGLGNLRSPYNTSFRGMGGSAAAGTPGINVNSFNPASYSFLRAATLDMAFEARSRSVFLGGKSTRSGTGNFSYFNLGMNLNQYLGLNIGFKPIANMYYNSDTSVNIPGLGNATGNFSGSGDLQYAFLGLAGQYKGFSVGLNFGYTFGNYDYSNSLKIPNTDTDGNEVGVRSSQLTHADNIGGIYWEGGLLYQANIGKENHLNIGATVTTSQKLNLTRNNINIAYHYLTEDKGGNLIVDTLQNNETRGKLTMPATYAFGMSYGKEGKWQVASDFSYTDWSLFNKMGDRDGIGDNAWRYSIGGSLTPNSSASNTKYLSFVTYRIGAYYGKDYFHLFNTNVNYYGGTIGTSLPLQRKYNNFGQLNLSLDIGKRGSITNGLAKEIYVNFTFGLSLNDTYWLKRPARYQ